MIAPLFVTGVHPVIVWGRDFQIIAFLKNPLVWREILKFLND